MERTLKYLLEWNKRDKTFKVLRVLGGYIFIVKLLYILNTGIILIAKIRKEKRKH